MQGDCNHEPSRYADGKEIHFRLPRVGGAATDDPSTRRSDKPIALLAVVCVRCGCLYVADDDRPDWGVRKQTKG